MQLVLRGVYLVSVYKYTLLLSFKGPKRKGTHGFYKRVGGTTSSRDTRRRRVFTHNIISATLEKTSPSKLGVMDPRYLHSRLSAYQITARRRKTAETHLAATPPHLLLSSLTTQPRCVIRFFAHCRTGSMWRHLVSSRLPQVLVSVPLPAMTYGGVGSSCGRCICSLLLRLCEKKATIHHDTILNQFRNHKWRVKCSSNIVS